MSTKQEQEEQEKIECALLDAVWITRWTDNKQALFAILEPEEAELSVKNIFSELNNIGYEIKMKPNNIENYSGKVIEFDDNIVKLECLIDKDNHIYEERVFNKSLFKNYDLQTDKYFLLQIFEIENGISIQIYSKPELESDFPQLNFVKEFSGSKIFKNKNK